jgi:site-specific DNA recombinase
MKLTATYARVSTARQEEEQTVKTQMSAVNDLLAKRTDLKVVEAYTDEGWSGDILTRPALDKLRQDAKAKRWQVLVVYDPDRLARRYSYQELVMDELREAGVEIVFVTVSAPKNSEDKILHGVRGLFAEYERAKIGERFRLGKLRKVKEGHILVSDPLYGYNRIPKQDKVPGYYEINDTEARVVRMLFDWVDKDGLTLRKLVRKLQEAGVKPRKSKRGVWATSTLSKILRNKAYIGQAHWGSSYAVVPEKPLRKEQYRKNRKTSRRMRPESEWITIPVPPIIDSAVFARVQDKLRANFLLSQRNTRNQYLLAGKIYCVCGRKRGGEGPQNGKYLYYRCLDRTLSYPLPPSCKEKSSVEARTADKLVWNGIANLMTSPDLMKKQIRLWMEKQHKSGGSSVADIHFLKKEIAKLNEQEHRYTQAYGNGLFSIEQFKEYAVPVREKVTSYELQLLKHEENQREFQTFPAPDDRMVKSFAKEVSKTINSLSFEAKRGILRNVVEKVVGTKSKLQIHGFIPIDNNVNVFTNHRDSASTPTHEVLSNPVYFEATLYDHITRIPFYFEIEIPRLDGGKKHQADLPTV